MESSASQSFSSSQQHYSALLATVSELRTDLERTIGKIHSLEQVNKDLTENYDTVKDELIETRKKYMEAQENYQRSATAKLESDKVNSVFMEKMKAQLNEKTKEFDVLREKFIPQDIDYVRIKVQEELEIPHRQRIQAMEAEVERQKDNYYAMRRESERYKADYEYFSQAQQREVGALRAEHESEVTALREQLVRLQSRDTGAEKDDKLRAQQIKIQELQRTVDILRQEKESLIHERDQCKVHLEQVKAQHESTVTQLNVQLAVASTDKLATESKLVAAASDNEAKESQIRAIRQQYEDAVTQLEQKALYVQDRESFFAQSREQQHEELEKLRARYEEEVRSKDDEVDALMHRLSEREEHVRKVQREATDMQLRADANEGELRRGQLAKLAELKQKNDALEMEAAVLKKDLQMALIHRNEMQEKAVKEANVLRSEISRIKREKEVILNRSTALEQALDAERRKLASSKRLTSARAAMSNDLVLEMKTKIADLELKLQDAREKEIHASSAVRAAEELLAHKEKEFALNVETLQREALARYEQLGKEYKEQLDAMKTQAQRAVMKERKRSEGYKEKALEAHNRGKMIQAVVAAGGNLGQPEDHCGLCLQSKYVTGTDDGNSPPRPPSFAPLA